MNFAALIETLRQSLEPVPGFQDIASAPYMFRPFIVLIVLGVAGGVVSVIVNLRKLEFNSEATVHSVFPGIVLGAFIGGIDSIIPGASLVGILVAFALTQVGRSGRGSDEAGTAVVLTSFFSIGMVISLRVADMSGQLEALMFGRLLDVTDPRMTQTCLVCLVALLVVLPTWRRQIFLAFDRDGARSAGMGGFWDDFAVNAALVAVTIAGSTAVGTLLIIGYLVVPGAAARLSCRSVRAMVPVAIFVGVAGGWLGLWIANLDAPRPISPQASVALSVVGLFFACLAVRGVRSLVAKVVS